MIPICLPNGANAGPEVFLAGWIVLNIFCILAWVIKSIIDKDFSLAEGGYGDSDIKFAAQLFFLGIDGVALFIFLVDFVVGLL